MNDLRVLVVAGDPLARAGLAALLADHGVVVGQTSPDEDLLAQLDVYRPTVVVWDMGWDSGPVPDRLADLVEDGPPVVALLAEASQAAALWTAGARGVLRRSIDTEHLLAALTAAVQGLAVLDPKLGTLFRTSSPVLSAEALTPRELDVLRLLVEGLPNKTIAHRMDISEHTVKFHLNAILNKLGAQSRTEAVVQAIRLGLITV